MWSPDLSKNISKFVDPRDNIEYRAVTIGHQTWLGEDMKFKTPSGSSCLNDDIECCIDDEYDNENGKCAIGYKDGCAPGECVYDWNAAQTACPSGYHLPSLQEWWELTEFANNNGSAYAEYIINKKSPDSYTEVFSCGRICTYPDETSMKCENYSNNVSHCKPNTSCMFDDKGNEITESYNYSINEINYRYHKKC